jgi:hypothetical protein
MKNKLHTLAFTLLVLIFSTVSVQAKSTIVTAGSIAATTTVVAAL